MDGVIQLLNPPSSIQPRGKNRTKLINAMCERMPLGEAAKHEMSSFPGKTPVSVLQELLSRRGITPKYELVQIEGAIHEPIFRYRVFINNEFIATGTGRSKKEAKHAAAKNLLDVLVGKQTTEQANDTNGTAVVPAEMPNTAASPYDDKVMGNPIGWLQEMCMSRRWPPPFYNMEHEEGLPHERQFTIACTVLKYKEIGTGKSKKLAKRMAAHKMWQALHDLPIEGAPTQVTEEDEELAARMSNLQTRYSGLKDSKINALTLNNNHSQKISQFHKHLRKATGSKIIELQQISLNPKEFNCVQFLKELGQEQRFDITYVDIEEKSVSGMYQCLVQMSTLPIAVCFGTGRTPVEAQTSGARNALEYLSILLAGLSNVFVAAGEYSLGFVYRHSAPVSFLHRHVMEAASAWCSANK